MYVYRLLFALLYLVSIQNRALTHGIPIVVSAETLKLVAPEPVIVYGDEPGVVGVPFDADPPGIVQEDEISVDSDIDTVLRVAVSEIHVRLAVHFKHLTARHVEGVGVKPHLQFLQILIRYQLRVTYYKLMQHWISVRLLQCRHLIPALNALNRTRDCHAVSWAWMHR